MRILILGGNGFIGSAVVQALLERGHSVTALARDTARAARRTPAATWLGADLARMGKPDDWTAPLAGIDAVVNCAGALQDGARDDVEAVQSTAMRALYAGATQSAVRLVVQISARTDAAGAGTAFFATKRAADDALKACGVPYVLLRPAVVVGRNAHGGTALLRALAALPAVTPLAYPETPMQFVAMDDLTAAVAAALDGTIAPGSDLDLAAPQVLMLREAVALHRAWLGLPPAHLAEMPGWVAGLTGAVADLLGYLGWRSPMRSTAMTVAAGGVIAAPSTPPFPLRSLPDTLGRMPAGAQDLWFARLYLLKPVVIGALSLFWLLSGAFALLCFDRSAAHLAAVGLSPAAATIVTIGTSLADITLGLGVLVRRHAAKALFAMVGLSLAYLATATLLQPALWADPLGPLVKVIPSIVLALVALAILDER